MIRPSYSYKVGGFKQGEVFHQIPGQYDSGISANPVVSRNSSTTRVNKEGLIEHIDSNIPRQTWPVYKGRVGRCPSLALRERIPQKLYWTERFNTSGTWTEQGVNVLCTETVAPTGRKEACLLRVTSTNTTCYVQQEVNHNLGTFVVSVFVKDGGDIMQGGSRGSGYFAIGVTGVGASSTSVIIQPFDLVNGTVLSPTSFGIAPEQTFIHEYPNGWFRVGFRYDMGTTNNTIIRFYASCNGPQDFNSGDYPGQSLQLYGANLVQSRQLQPYIKSESTLKIQEADSLRTFVGNDYIYSKEGIFFISLKLESDQVTFNSNCITLNNGTVNNKISFNFRQATNNFIFIVKKGTSTGSTTQSFFETSLDFTKEIKLAVHWKQGLCLLYYNGNQIHQDTNFNTFDGDTLTRIDADNGNQVNKFKCGDIYELSVYDTRTLSNTKVVELLKQLTEL
tara:strand:+ start:2332 stop:3678 length:1347 start_codon:yes stop_codon:yes gene_type:complete